MVDTEGVHAKERVVAVEGVEKNNDRKGRTREARRSSVVGREPEACAPSSVAKETYNAACFSEAPTRRGSLCLSCREFLFFRCD